MAWMRHVCGRLESRFRYSAGIVYNNFPFPPSPSLKQVAAVEAAAQQVLAARAEFGQESLATLSDPLTMPPALVRAHATLDKAVDGCYRPAAFPTELSRLEFLFAAYRQLQAPLLPAPAKAKRVTKTYRVVRRYAPHYFAHRCMNTYTLDYRPDLHIVFLRWLQPDTLAEAQASYRDALALALAHGCGNWLLDSRRCGPLDLFETAWLTREFFPAAVEELAPRPLRMAVFSSMQRFDQMHADSAVAPAVQAAIAATQPYEAAIFMAEAEAVAWLQAAAA